MRVASTIQLGLAAAFAVVALALRGPIQDDLLEGNETLYWVFFSAVLFYAASYFARGFLAGQRRFGLFTALILSESCFRTSFAVLVAVSMLERPVGGRDRDRRRPRPQPDGRARSPSPRKREKRQAPGMPGREAEDMPESARRRSQSDSSGVGRAEEFSLAPRRRLRRRGAA